jgi:hypothetical protein
LKSLIFILILLIAGSVTLLAQLREISGKVTDQDTGNPLPGVGVKVKGTAIATVTNLDGVYNLSVPEDANTLIFTCVGMKTSEMNIDGRSIIDVTMATDIFGLGDFIVTGYTIQTKESLTGSVSMS